MDGKKLFFSNADLRNLILPLVVDQFLQAFVGLADSVMVSSVGEAAVSGVSLIDTVMVLVINIFTALATGGAVITGQFLGKQRSEMACKATNQLLAFTLKASLAVMILGYLGRNLITRVIFGNIEADVLYNCNVYMLIVFASIPMIALYNAGAAAFRAMGNSSIAMKTSLLMNAINICGNAIFDQHLRKCHFDLWASQRSRGGCNPHFSFQNRGLYCHAEHVERSEAYGPYLSPVFL